MVVASKINRKSGAAKMEALYFRTFMFPFALLWHNAILALQTARQQALFLEMLVVLAILPVTAPAEAALAEQSVANVAT